MTTADAEAAERFVVVVNDEGHHSLWWHGRPVPPGWRTASEPATREECLARIEQDWTDLRPRRRHAAVEPR
ncbi:MbtH family protein [Streptomyces sp. YU58]|uniref:MbtH family protein n=1 Tax=Streptomyces sp. SX92 TaxID=3158972 RepID=UPI0027B94A78|nr:MbtH family protein [Streptomyces coralus]WLW53081.1 MbtH family protein [Streptomyces coralus]